MVDSTTPSTQAAGPSRTRGLLTEVAQVALLAILLYVVIQVAIQTVHVIGLSMFPTLHDQDYLIATRIDYRFHNPQRGDIIIMRDPYDPSRDFIKRVIAVPGDRLLIRDGEVFLNGHRVTEPYISQEPWTQNGEWGAPDGIVMKSDEYFVMGDNRNHSSDSRSFGVVHRNQIEARAWLRVLPASQFGPVDGSKPEIQAAAAPAPAQAPTAVH